VSTGRGAIGSPVRQQTTAGSRHAGAGHTYGGVEPVTSATSTYVDCGGGGGGEGGRGGGGGSGPSFHIKQQFASPPKYSRVANLGRSPLERASSVPDSSHEATTSNRPRPLGRSKDNRCDVLKDPILSSPLSGVNEGTVTGGSGTKV